MSQQPNMLNDEIWESTELMQAIIESYLDSNPLIKRYARGFQQLFSSFAENILHQNFMNENNYSQNNSNKSSEDNNNDHPQNGQKDSNNNNIKNNDENANNNESKNNNNTDKNDDNTDQEQQSNSAFQNLFDLFGQICSQINQNNNSQPCPFLSSFMQLLAQMHHQQEETTDNEYKNESEKDSLIEDLIMQTLNPEIYEQPTNSQNKEDSNENMAQKGDKISNILEMIKIIYQVYLQDENHPENFIKSLFNAFNNVKSQFSPHFSNLNQKNENFSLHDLFNSDFFKAISNFLMNQESSQNQEINQNHQCNKKNDRAELRRSITTNSNGNVIRKIRHSIGNRWHEVETEVSQDGETIKATNETWNDISEDEFESFKQEWELLYKNQRI